MGDHGLEALRSAEATPLAQLQPEIDGAASRVVDGVVTIVWPYSSIKLSTAFVLAERDHRLRSCRGQIRVEFRAAAAKALADAAIGAGDEVRISLKGAQWRKVEPQMRLPQGSSDWQLFFESRLLLSLRRAQDQSSDVVQNSDFIDIDVPDEAVESSSESRPLQAVPMISHIPAQTAFPAMPDPINPSSLLTKRRAPPDFETDEFASPAFLKRARISYGPLFEGGIEEMFIDGDKEKKRNKKKRSSFFGKHATSWKYSSRSPSPASGHDTDDGEASKGVKTAEKPAKTSPPRPTMVDSASQTQEIYFSPSITGLHASVNNSAPEIRTAHHECSNDDFYTPSRTLFERRSNQHITSRMTEVTTIASEDHPLGLTAETHSNAMIGATAFAGGTSVPHYPLSNNHIPTPATNIDPSLQYSTDVHADEHLYYAAGGLTWHAEPPAGENSLASVRAGIRDSAFTVAASSPWRSRRLVSAGSGSNGSYATSRLPLSQFERRSSTERAREAEMMDEDDHYHAYPRAGRAPGEEYDLGTQAGVDNGEASEERSPHNTDALEQENVVTAGDVVDSFIGYENSRSRTDSYSSDGRSNARMEANYGMQRQYQDGYEAEFEHDYDARYGANESDEGSGSVSATPREPVVIDLLSDSDEDAGGPQTAPSQAPDVPARRRQYETASIEADDDEVSDRSDADVEDVVSDRSEADVDDNEPTSARSAARSDDDMEENDALARSDTDAGEDKVSNEEVKEDEAAARSAKSRASETSNEDVGESNAAPRCAESQERSVGDVEEMEASARSDVESEASARSLASARVETDDGKNEASAGCAKSQVSSTSDAKTDKAEDLKQEMEQGEARSGQAHDTGAEDANSEHERASEEGSQRGDLVMEDARHTNEGIPLAEGTADSSSPEVMDADVKETPGHSKGDVEEQAEDDDEPMEAIAEENEMDVEAMASQPPRQDDGDVASQPDARAEESDLDVESLASQPPRQQDVDGALLSSQVAEENASTENVGADSETPTSKSEIPGHVEVAVIIPQHLGQDVGGEAPSHAEADKDEERWSEVRAGGQAAESKSDDEFQDAPSSPQHDQEEIHDAGPADEDPTQQESTPMGNQGLSSPQPEDQPEQGAEESVTASTQTTTKNHHSRPRGEDEELDGSQTNTRSLRDKSRAKGKGQELEVLIPARSLRHSRRASSAASQELREDPSVALAQAASSPQSSGLGPGKETRSGARLRAASSNHKSDETDPSLRLARTTVPEATQAKIGSPTTRKADGPTNRNKQLQTTPETATTATTTATATTTTTTRELRSFGRASSPVESVQASPSATVTGGDDETAEAKRKLLMTLRTRLAEAVPLRSLRSQLNRTVDVVAMSTMTPAQPHRPKHGPRDYMLELVLTDASTAPGRVVVAQLFRPHVESLPVVQAGDVVLLRRVQVTSLQGRGFGVRAGEASAWAVFEKDETEMLAQIKGPPVEVTEGEVEYARGLKQWWALVMRDERAMTRVEKATGKKASRAKEAKDRA